MSSLAHSPLNHGLRGFLHFLRDRWETFLNSIAEAKVVADRYRSLSRLSDAELAQRGLRREDIPMAAFRG